MLTIFHPFTGWMMVHFHVMGDCKSELAGRLWPSKSCCTMEWNSKITGIGERSLLNTVETLLYVIHFYVFHAYTLNFLGPVVLH